PCRLCKASRLIRSAGRFRQEPMRRRFCVSHAPSQNHQAGSEALLRQGGVAPKPSKPQATSR
ncbi:MAG: hypothetical protein ACK5Q1_02690, partial [Limnobacter sp.]